MKVIKQKNLPVRLPIWSTLITAMALQFYHAPQWVWGAMGLLFLFGWIVAIVAIAKQEETDIFEEKDK